MIRNQTALLLVSAAACAACPILFAEKNARADEHSIIKLPGDHPRYVFEAEPHLVVGWGDPFYRSGAVGAGFRGTFHIANGFIKTINDSVGIGVGIDVTSDGHVLVPVVMQWNFWLSTHWSVFGEPGFAIGAGGPRTPVWPAFFAGARVHFTNRVALTMRLGYPALSVGVSFLL